MGFLDYKSTKYNTYFDKQSTSVLDNPSQSRHSNHLKSSSTVQNSSPNNYNNEITRAMISGCPLLVISATAVATTAAPMALSAKQSGQRQYHISNIISSVGHNNNSRVQDASLNSSDASAAMPSDGELDELFTKVLATMDLPPDKSKVLWGYDKDKKWELIRDQQKVHAKQEPGFYLAKLRSYTNNPNRKLRQQVTSRFQVSRKRKSRLTDGTSASIKTGNASATQILRDLEISLRTNSIEWVREFLSEKNDGLHALIEFLSFRLATLRNEHFSHILSEHAAKQKDSELRGKSDEFNYRSFMEQQSLFVHNTPTNLLLVSGTSNDSVNSDDIHVCIMCLRSIMNNKRGFNMVMEHPQAINCLALSLNHTSIRTKTLVLELLAVVCLVKGGHELIMAAFDNFKMICYEKLRFETLIYYFTHQEKFNVDFMVSCLQFINIIVHSQDDMNYRTHLQHEFTNLALDKHLEKLKQNESEELQVQIQTYLDNRIDVSALAEEAETKNTALVQVQQLIEKLSISNELQSQLQLNYHALDSRLQEALKKNEELTRSLDDYKKQLALQSEIISRNNQTNQTNPPSAMAITSAPKLPEHHDLQQSAKPTHVQIRSYTDKCSDDRQSTTRILVNCASETVKGQAPPPPPPPPPPLQYSSMQPILAPPPPPPPIPPPLPVSIVSNCGSKKGMAPQPPTQQSKLTLQNSTRPNHVPQLNTSCDMMTLKKTFTTQYKLPTFNWSVLKPNQVRGTIFSEFHDEEKIIHSIDFTEFEEQFRLGNRSSKPRRSTQVAESVANPSEHLTNQHFTKDQDSSINSRLSNQTTRFKQPEKISFMEHNRLRNMAISLRKLATPADLLTSIINRLDIEQLTLDSIEILSRMIPTDQEIKAYQDYEKQGKPTSALTDEDRFLCQIGKIDRLEQKVKIMSYMKNLDSTASQSGNSLSSSYSISSSNTDTGDILAATKAKIEYVESASRSLRASDGIRILLEYILVFGNYLNSSSRLLASAPAYGYKLQALDMVTEARSTQDKARNLLHFIVDTILKNLSPNERAELTSTINSHSTSHSDSLKNRNIASPSLGSGRGKRLSPSANFDQDALKMPYDLDSLFVELEQAANVSLETLIIEVREFEKGMDSCVKELHLRCAAADALAEQSDPAAANAPSNDRGRPKSPYDGSSSIKNPSDESICRLQTFIKSRSSEILEVKELVQRAQREFNECAQYFGENPRTIESSALFSIFLRLLKNVRQCQVDNKLVEKRKFDEELRKEIQQQQVLRANKKRQNILENHNNNNNNGKSELDHQQSSPQRHLILNSRKNGLNAQDMAQLPDATDSNRLLHQDEVSHGTLDILITGLKVEPYRRIDGSRKSMRRLEHNRLT